MKFIILVFTSLFIFGCVTTGGGIIPPPKDKPELKSFLPENRPFNWRLYSGGQPAYPQRELYYGITGWVAVKFDVTEDGKVINTRVVDSSPDKVFDRSAVESISRRTYTYTGVSGVPEGFLGAAAIVNFDIRKE